MRTAAVTVPDGTVYPDHVAATVILVTDETFPEPALLHAALAKGNAG
jgi:hypothetical protein